MIFKGDGNGKYFSGPTYSPSNSSLNEIIDAIDLNEKNYSNAAHVVNNWIVDLHDNAHTYFSDEILEKYSCKTKW